MRAQWPPTAWQRVCRRSRGRSTRGSAVTQYTCPPVPAVTMAEPGSTSPQPTAAQAVSPAPATTGSPSGRPMACAGSASSRPASPVEGSTSGSFPWPAPTSSHASGCHRRCTTSNSSVAEASVSSVAHRPVRWWRRKSLGRQTRSAAASRSGSCRRTHRSEGPVKPATGGLQSSASRAGPSRSPNSRASAALRPSAQVMAGPTGRPSRRQRTRVCIWPLNPRAS